MKDTRRTILSQMIDIGGTATKNNFYSPAAASLNGSRLSAHKYWLQYLKSDFIRLLAPPIKIQNKINEYFYAITNKGAAYANRKDDYKWSDKKSPNNVMHESMIRDVALAFLRLYKGNISIKYDLSYNGVRPDITVRVDNCVFFVEIERKKTVDRVFDKVKTYEKMFETLDYGKYGIPKQAKVLILYANYYEYDGFWRPQEYAAHQDKIKLMERQLTNIFKFTANTPDRYLFTTFDKFYILNEAVWYNTKGVKCKLFNY